MPGHAISVSLDEGRAVVALPGEHESYTAHKLERSLEGLIDEAVPVVVDLRETTFVDSTVVGVLIAASRRAATAGLGFALLLGEATGWPVRRMIEVTGLDAQIDVQGP